MKLQPVAVGHNLTEVKFSLIMLLSKCGSLAANLQNQSVMRLLPCAWERTGETIMPDVTKVPVKFMNVSIFYTKCMYVLYYIYM